MRQRERRIQQNKMDKNTDSFQYTYSAKQQEEVKRIRQKYLPPEEDKIEQLRKLDESATKPGTIAAIIVGMLGTLTMGLGMTCTMVWTEYFVPGIFVGLVGIAGIAAAYPLYNFITKKQRQKLAPVIMKLSDELLR